MTLLDPALLARLESLQLGTRRRLAGFLTGDHRSPRYGTSMDFADYREYHPGDDFRRIDYHLYARLDVLLIKLYEAEDEVHLRLLLDTSGSMGLYGKLRQAARVAAALGFVALAHRDPVSVHTFPFDRPGPRFLGRNAAPALMAHLEAQEAGGPTEFAAAAAHLLARPGPPGITVVLSDLMTPEWEPAINRLPARRGDLVVVHVLANEELHPETVGDVELVDKETGSRVAVSLTDAAADRYHRVVEEWLTDVEARCHRVGAAYLRVLADEPLEPLLLTAWRRGGVLR